MCLLSNSSTFKYVANIICKPFNNALTLHRNTLGYLC